jgi:predicted AAA+ superfamily ATPase
MGSHALRGALFESFVLSEMLKRKFNLGQLDNYFFWHDRTGNEVDVLIKRGKHIQSVEIKSGRTINRYFFKGLQKWTALAGDIASAPLSVYGGDELSERYGVGVFPWHSFLSGIN